MLTFVRHKEVKQMSEQQFIRSTAPTLAGLKTGSLLPYRYSSKENALAELRAYNRKRPPNGRRLLPLRMTESLAMLWLYRLECSARSCKAAMRPVCFGKQALPSAARPAASGSCAAV